MKKTKKTQGSNFHRNIELPSIMNMETLSYASDDDLNRHLHYLFAEKDRASRAEYELQPWEVEICYVLREVQIRHDRRAAHERYLRSNPDASFYSPSAGH